MIPSHGQGEMDLAGDKSETADAFFIEPLEGEAAKSEVVGEVEAPTILDAAPAETAEAKDQAEGLTEEGVRPEARPLPAPPWALEEPRVLAVLSARPWWAKPIVWTVTGVFAVAAYVSYELSRDEESQLGAVVAQHAVEVESAAVEQPALVKLKDSPDVGGSDSGAFPAPSVVDKVAVDEVVVDGSPAVVESALGEAIEAPVLTPQETQESPAQPESASSMVLVSARELLDRFLEAATIEERLPMIESRRPLSELRRSCLASPLPRVLDVQLEYQDPDLTGLMVDHHYAVMFVGGGAAGPYPVLVRERSGQSPLVMGDAFIDLYGGHLKGYAAAPVDGVSEFEVMVTALAGCKDEGVPNGEDKRTLKLMARDRGREIARAYFKKGSSISRLLEDGSFRLSYGNPTLCRVMLRWNREEDAQMPYLEAVKISEFGWGSRE